MKIDLSIQPKVVLLTLCAQFSGFTYAANIVPPLRPNLIIVMADHQTF